MDVLVVDVGGTHVKILATGQDEPRKFVSGPGADAPGAWSSGVKSSSPGLEVRRRVDRLSRAGAPRPPDRGAAQSRRGLGRIRLSRAHSGGPSRSSTTPPCRRWGATRAGTMLFLGLGTGLGSTLIVDGIVEPMELGHLPYKKGTYEDYVGLRGLEKRGKKKWRRHVADVVARLDRRPRARRRRARWRQREEAERAAAGLPRGRQRQRVRRGLSPCGTNGSKRASKPTAKSTRTDSRHDRRR